MAKRTGTTNIHLQALINDLKRLASKENIPLWKRLAYELERPSKNRREVSIGKIKKGNPHHGPFFPERPDRILKRTIKNMLPYKQYKGKRAFKNITCYLGIPENIKENNAITVESAKLKETAIKYIKLKELIRLLKQK